jgi:single-strand DNA-binding protein
MAHVNKITLVGNLGDDPKSINFGNGGLAARFSLATSERWNDKRSGQQWSASSGIRSSSRMSA